MKKEVLGIMAIAAVMVFGTSCSKHEKDKLIGRWKIASVEFQQFKQQEEYDQKQIAMLEDSIKANSDTAKVARFQRLLENTKRRSEQMKQQQDTMIAKSRWEFKSNGDFSANEMQGENKGIWSYDEEKGILFTIIDERTSSVHVKFKADTLVLELDSLNYMNFVRSAD